MKKLITAITLCLMCVFGFGQNKVNEQITIGVAEYENDDCLKKSDFVVRSENVNFPYHLESGANVSVFALTTANNLQSYDKEIISGYLLNRGANKLFASIGIGIGSTAIAVPIMLCSDNSQGRVIAGGVILGIGGLTALITTISGINDLKKAGIVLQGGSITFKLNTLKIGKQ